MSLALAPTARASSVGELPTDDPILADAWLRSFEALCRRQGLTDTPEERQVTDLFLTLVGLEAVSFVADAVRPLEIESMSFCDIKRQLLDALQARQLTLIARRASFVSLRQEAGETPRQFAARLQDSAAACEFRTAVAASAAAGELTLAVLIAGLRDPRDWARLRDRLRLSRTPVTLEACLRCLDELQAQPPLEGGDDSVAAALSPAEFVRQWRTRSASCCYLEVRNDSQQQQPPQPPPLVEEEEAEGVEDAVGESGDSQQPPPPPPLVEEEEAEDVENAVVESGDSQQQPEKVADCEKVVDQPPVEEDAADGQLMVSEPAAAAVDEASAQRDGGSRHLAKVDFSHAAEIIYGDPKVFIQAVGKQFHAHVMSHQDDICVEADTAEELEATVNNLVLLMDDVQLAIKYKELPEARSSGKYWTPLMAAKTAFRVRDFS